MKLSRKARRFVSEAARDLGGSSSRDRLQGWLNSSGTSDVPPAIAVLAVTALEQLQQELRQRLSRADVDEDRQADIMNDIAFIHSVETDLRPEAARA